MLRNKKVLFALISLVSLRLTQSNAQDKIVRYHLETRTVTTDNLVVQNNTAMFRDINTNQVLETSIENIYRITSVNSTITDILLGSYQYDTINCIIDSIAGQEIFYRQTGAIRQSVHKSEVFAILFNDSIESTSLNYYKPIYEALFKQTVNLPGKIILRNGTEIIINYINEINTEEISYNFTGSGKRFNASLAREQISEIILREPYTRKSRSGKNYYLLSGTGRIFEANYLSEFKSNSFRVHYTVGGQNLSSIQLKQGLSALVFDKMQTNANDIKATGKTYYNPRNLPEYSIKADISAGPGYMILKPTSNIDEDINEYYDDMRLSITYDANFTVLINQEIGVGIKFNQFFTSNSQPGITEDNIKVNFLGGTLLANIPLSGQLGFFYASFSLGSLRLENKGQYL